MLSRHTLGPPRRAFTLVELLVAIAIIGILIALLLPAVQAAREAGRRTQCANHLRQLGLAMHNYEGAERHLPPGFVSRPADGFRDDQTGDAAPGWGWAAYLLSYMEEGSVSQSAQFDLPIWDPDHVELVRLTLPTMLCPSSSGPAESFLVEGEASVVGEQGTPLTIGGGTVELGRSHYVASHGQESCWGDCGGADSQEVFSDIYAGDTGTTIIVNHQGDVSKIADGPFYRNSATRFRQITDGLSKTIFLGEHASSLSDKTWVGVVPGAFSNPRFASPENGPDTAATLVLVHAGPSGGERDQNDLPIIHPINFPTYHVGQMYSDHPGGGNVGLGDASVRFVTDDVDLLLWAEYSSIAEGEATAQEL
ncbi:MAG: DUF1559 domain-containing protein [Planctomycetota bacterium]